MKHRKHHTHYRRHGHNPPEGIMEIFRDPIPHLEEGAVGLLGATLTILGPNIFLIKIQGYTNPGFLGVLFRLVSRIAAGSVLGWGTSKVVPRLTRAIVTGSTIAAFGGAVFDLLGASLILGRGDTGQTALPGFQGYTNQLPGLAAYVPDRPGFAKALPGMAGMGRSMLYPHSLYRSGG